MGFIGELPGLIYDPEKKKYFKKAPVETRKHIQPHAFVPTISPSSLLQPLIYSQIYDKNYCPRQPESIIVGSLPNPVEIQYPYIKLFDVGDDVHCWYAVSSSQKIYSLGCSLPFVQEDQNLKSSEFDERYSGNLIMDLSSFSTHLTTSSSLAFSASKDRISVTSYHPTEGPGIFSRSISNNLLSEISWTRFPSYVSNVWCITTPSISTNSSLLVAGTDGNIKNRKRIHVLDVERATFVRGMQLGNTCSDVLSLCSVSSETIFAGLRNGNLFSIDLREPRRSGGFVSTALHAGISFILKPTASDFNLVIGTLHDQLYLFDSRSSSQPVFQYEVPNCSFIPSLLPRVPLATLGAYGTLLHVVAPLSKPLSLLSFLVDSPISIGSKLIGNVSQRSSDDDDHDHRRHHIEPSYSQLICYEERPILL